MSVLFPMPVGSRMKVWRSRSSRETQNWHGEVLDGGCTKLVFAASNDACGSSTMPSSPNRDAESSHGKNLRRPSISRLPSGSARPLSMLVCSCPGKWRAPLTALRTISSIPPRRTVRQSLHGTRCDQSMGHRFRTPHYWENQTANIH